MIGDVISGVKFLFDSIRVSNDKSQQYRKDLFNNFVEPIYSQLESAHKLYLDSFQSYRVMIEATDLPLNMKHPVFDLMQKDHALTDADRAKLVGMAEYMNTFRSTVAKQMSEDATGRFAQHVVNYITTPADAVNTRWPLNAPRRNLMARLMGTLGGSKSAGGKRKEAIRLLDEAVDNLQRQYAAITRDYMELKANLLT